VAAEEDGDAEEAEEEAEEEVEEAPDTAEALQLAAAHRDRCGRRPPRRRLCTAWQAATEPVIAQALLEHGGRLCRPAPAGLTPTLRLRRFQLEVNERAKAGGDMFDEMVAHEEAIRLGEDGWKCRYYRVRRAPTAPAGPAPPRGSAAPHARLPEREQRRKRGGPGSYPGVASAASTGAAAAHCALSAARPLQHGRAVRGQCRPRPAPAGQAGRGRRGAGPTAAGHGARVRGGPVLGHALLLRRCAGPASGAVSLEAPLVSLDRNLPLVRICRLAKLFAGLPDEEGAAASQVAPARSLQTPCRIPGQHVRRSADLASSVCRAH